MDQMKQIINAINLALFDRSVLPCAGKKDLKKLFFISKKQNVVGLVWEGLKKEDGQLQSDADFDEYTGLYTYQYVCQSIALEQITKELNRRGYEYVVLKGGRMRKFYPQPQLRTCCDIDILTAEEDDRILEMMSELGYQFSSDGGTTLNFKKAPAVEIEMHRRLFDDGVEYSEYFNSIWSRTVREGDNTYERLLTEEDFYAFMVAHAAKHLTRYGCGIRPIIDIYLYLRYPPEQFERTKARQLLKEIKLLEFEQRICALTKAWFETGELTKADETLTKFIFTSGIYGNEKIAAAQKIRKDGKGKFRRGKLLIKHVFPPCSTMRPMYPGLMKCPVFLPLAWVLRWFRLLFRGRKQTAKMLKDIKSMDDQFFDNIDETMKELQL